MFHTGKEVPTSTQDFFTYNYLNHISYSHHGYCIKECVWVHHVHSPLLWSIVEDLKFQEYVLLQKIVKILNNILVSYMEWFSFKKNNI